MKAPSLTVVRMLISPGSGDGTNKFTVSFFLQEYGRLIRFLPRFFAFGGFHRGFMCYRIFVASLVSLQGGQKPSNGGQIIYELYEGNPINLHHPLKSLVPPKISLSLRPSGWDSKTKEKCSFNCSRNCHTPLFLIDAGTGIIDRKGYKYALACGTKFVHIVEALWEQTPDISFSDTKQQFVFVVFEQLVPRKTTLHFQFFFESLVNFLYWFIFWCSWQGQARLVEITCNIIVCFQDLVATVFPERCNETASKHSHHLRDSLSLCSHNENRTLR